MSENKRERERIRESENVEMRDDMSESRSEK